MQSSGFTGFDGILGFGVAILKGHGILNWLSISRIGPVDLTLGTLFPDVIGEIPTVVDNLWTQDTISSYEIGISFEPTTSESNENGEISWGLSLFLYI